MQNFQLGFDLRGATRQQYRRITRAIVSMGDAVRATQSQWLLSSALSESEVRRRLVMHVGRGRVMVSTLGDCIGHSGMSPDVLRWLERHGYLPGSDLDLAA